MAPVPKIPWSSKQLTALGVSGGNFNNDFKQSFRAKHVTEQHR